MLTNLKGHLPGAEIRFYRTNHGSELDFLVFSPNSFFAVECKASKAPVLSRGTYSAIHDLKPKYTFIVSPVKEDYQIKKDIEVVSLKGLITKIKKMI